MNESYGWSEDVFYCDGWGYMLSPTLQIYRCPEKDLIQKHPLGVKRSTGMRLRRTRVTK